MKKIFLGLLLLLVTGCSAEYNLSYENNEFKENLTITDQKDNIIDGQSFSRLVDNYYNNVVLLTDFQDQPGDMSEEEILQNYSVYNKSLINDGQLYGLKLNHNFRENEVKNSAIIYTLFKNINITDKTIRVSKGENIFENYPALDEIKVTFKTDKDIINSNADEVKKGVYYWYIDRDNYKTKTINVDLSVKNKSVIKEIDISDYNYIIFILLGVLLGISLIVVFIKVKNSNKK